MSRLADRRLTENEEVFCAPHATPSFDLEPPARWKGVWVRVDNVGHPRSWAQGCAGQVTRTVPRDETATEPAALPVWLAVAAALSR
jgi:hypothetical protein